MNKKNFLYIGILVWATLLSILNLSIARKQADHSLLDPLVDVCDLIHRHYVKEIDDEELVNGAINGMLQQLDPYSEYIPPQQVEEFQKQTSGSYEGIGIGIDVKDGYITVISPFENSPAFKAGVQAGDVILEVNGRSAKGWSASQAVQELTGPAFSDLTIKVRHLDGREEVIRIVRQEIHVPTVRGWRRTGRDGSWDYLLDPAAAIGYVRITSFTADTAQELDQAVSPLLGRNLKALILDLRTNPGGLMSSAVEVVDRFIEQGTIVSTRGAHSEDQVQKAHPENTYPRFILVVLIDQGSASGAEIVAGALQDHNRAVIVGRRSWGKGSVQRLIRLPESEAALKLTTDYYYLPNGRCVHRLGDAETWGVSPDIEESLDPDKVTELRSYMNHLTIDALTQAAQNGRANGDPNAPASPGEIAAGPADSATVVAAVAEKLLVLDDQLAQALKQCKGLLRTRPTLPGLAESFGQAKPAAEPDQPEEPQTK